MSNQYTNPWTKKEDKYLIKYYGVKFGKDIAKELGRTYIAVRHRARRLNLYAPLSDFKNNNPAKIPIIKEKIRKFQKARWNDPNSVLNSEEYRNKQKISITKKWKDKKYSSKLRPHIINLGKANKGKIRSSDERKINSSIKKALWSDKSSKYNSPKFKSELKKRVKDMNKVNQSSIVTKPELLIKELLEENKFKFYHNKNFKIRVDRYFPDFINKNEKKIIEVFGDYWHCNPQKYPNPSKYQKEKIERDKRKLRVYKKLGFKTLIIWEDEIKNQNALLKKIKIFMKQGFFND